MDRARAFRGGVTGNSSRERKLNEEFPQSRFILTDIRVNFAVGSLEVGIAHDRRPAMSWAGDVNHVEIVFLDDTVEVHVDEVLSWSSAPMSEEHVLHVC